MKRPAPDRGRPLRPTLRGSEPPLRGEAGADRLVGAVRLGPEGRDRRPGIGRADPHRTALPPGSRTRLSRGGSPYDSWYDSFIPRVRSANGGGAPQEEMVGAAVPVWFNAPSATAI